MPPPAEGLASRLLLGPALRAQPDRRLVTLVREGYEAAFEEIVRRYGRSLGRYAASIVGGRSEDVLQEAFVKALPALQRDDAEIDLRPWLFRIVRNTALNDLRDSPPSRALLAEALAGGRNPADELEQREQLADLMRRLRELPDAQRAAIVMRELEGLSHEEIAAALGLSGGGARQAIYRARQALRDGAGLLLPLPLLRLLIGHGGAGVGGALATAGASAGGAGAGGAVKLGVVAAVLAGSVGAGVALDRGHPTGTAAATPAPPALERKRGLRPSQGFERKATEWDAGRTGRRGRFALGPRGGSSRDGGQDTVRPQGREGEGASGDPNRSGHDGGSGREGRDGRDRPGETTDETPSSHRGGSPSSEDSGQGGAATPEDSGSKSGSDGGDQALESDPPSGGGSESESGSNSEKSAGSSDEGSTESTESDPGPRLDSSSGEEPSA